MKALFPSVIAYLPTRVMKVLEFRAIYFLWLYKQRGRKNEETLVTNNESYK